MFPAGLAHNEPIDNSTLHRYRRWGIGLLGGLVLTLALLALLLAFFPWDMLRGPLNRYVSEQTGRRFEITRHLDVKLGLTSRILADGIEFANPDWARDSHLVKAESAQIDVKLLPLLRGRIELPRVQLRRPVLGLQLEADGRRSWSLGRDTSDLGKVPVIGTLVVDEGNVHFVAIHHGADIQTDFGIGDSQLPLAFKASGTWQKEVFSATGRAGNVLQLNASLQHPFPIEVRATAGHTVVRATGTVARLATLEGADAQVELQGRNLADLYHLLGVVLPATPRYMLRGHLTKRGETWEARAINGKLGASDLGGDLSYDQSGKVPLLSGRVQSQSLDFDDLAPVVGMAERPRSAAALPQVTGPLMVPVAAAGTVVSGPTMLPRGKLDLQRLTAMDADIHYSAARVTHVKQLPLDSLKLHVLLRGGVLQLDPLAMGVAGGTVDGLLRIDGNSNPAQARVKLTARSLELNKLFPAFKVTQASFGKVQGEIDLNGRGNSAAQLLGSSSGNVALQMGAGRISNLFLEIAGLDGGEIIKFMFSGDKEVGIRCAAAAFDVKAGLMSSRTLLLDSEDTVIHGEGRVNLANETLDLTLRPYPKDMSILALRSPLKVTGSFMAPRTGPDKGALAGRAGLALALGAINPLLGLLATVETGPGKDADCAATARVAAAPARGARVAAAPRR